MSQPAAVVLCERVLADLGASGEVSLVDRLHESAEFERGALQTFAVRISLAVFSGDSDTAYIPLEQFEHISFGEALGLLAADKWGREAGQAIIDVLNDMRQASKLPGGFGLPTLYGAGLAGGR